MRLTAFRGSSYVLPKCLSGAVATRRSQTLTDKEFGALYLAVAPPPGNGRSYTQEGVSVCMSVCVTSSCKLPRISQGRVIDPPSSPLKFAHYRRRMRACPSFYDYSTEHRSYIGLYAPCSRPIDLLGIYIAGP